MRVKLSRTANHRFNGEWVTYQAGVEYVLDEKLEQVIALGKTSVAERIGEAPKPVAAPEPVEKKPKRARKK